MANEKLISDLISRAEKNWTRSQTKDLKRLICSVILSKRYDRVTETDMKIFDEEEKNEIKHNNPIL